MSNCNSCSYSISGLNRFLTNLVPYFDEEIADRSYQQPNFFYEMLPVEYVPDFTGTQWQKMRFYGDIGANFSGMETWTPEAPSTAGDDHTPRNDACGYKWETIGHGIETLNWGLFRKMIRTEQYCLEDWRYSWNGETIQDLIFNSLSNVTVHQTEQLVRNSLSNFSVKYVCDSAGLKTNPANPYLWPSLGATLELGPLTPQMAIELYERLVRKAARWAVAKQNGRPMFLMSASSQTFDYLFLNDPGLRQDLRFASFSDDLLKRFSFMDSYRGLFALYEDINARRMDRDDNGNLYEVFPLLRGVQTQQGTRVVDNPAYNNAEFEVVRIFGLNWGKLRTRAKRTSIGGASRFEPRSGMFEWAWYSHKCPEDPEGKTGFYYTEARLGMEPGDFTDWVEVLIKRPPTYLAFNVYPEKVCPTAPEACTNVLPAQGCPCPQIIGVTCGVADGVGIFTFDRDPNVAVAASISIRTKTGATVVGTVQAKNGTRYQILFAGASLTFEPGNYIEQACVDYAECFSNVIAIKDCTPGDNEITIVTAVPLKVDAADVVEVKFGNGSTQQVTIASVANAGLNEYTITVADPDDIEVLACENGGICAVCVVPTVGNGCPACAAELEACGGASVTLPTC